ncbi:NAD(P)H-binding protein [Streptomyces turgidiscabies]|uniref:NAD dependent epimerase/dehydratase family protein n=1 Tax=Streptomyces turgidiscabies (strain Car8) TaxID=698760 RepID=L7EWA8_STRT8|nr:MULTISPECIES: NAD(P)H-binding protein [Streptomyces]ELP63698.1 NAD dependent epimerase/dehydratase family protein [Streptomyces turgidiscabies Car8]MDX3495089.1 NAD(P)H-binding protein [Streptomyces turgidiscabies]GAQ70962.1 NAD(P)H azoreductase [Streptomyces turgidiscabies]
MILLTGATGTVGRLVAERLSGAGPLRLLTRRPERVTLAGPGIEVVRGDFDDPAGLRAALVGVRSALLVTANPLAPAQDRNFVAASRAAGVSHVVKLSAQAVTEPAAIDLITDWQRENERLLRASGLGWTFLRPRAFMSNTLGWARSVQEEGVVRGLDGASRNANVDPRDIADAAVQALTNPEAHAGRAYALTGPAGITPAEQTEILGHLLQRQLTFMELTEAQLLRGLLARHPEPVALALVESAARGRDGGKGQVEPDVQELLGRPGRGYREWATEHLAEFGG